MNVKDSLLNVLKLTENQVYVYVSKNKKNLDDVKQYMVENVDFTKTTTKVVLVHPIGINKIVGEVDGVLVDKNSTGETFLKTFITLKEGAPIQWVDEATMEFVTEEPVTTLTNTIVEENK